MDETPGAISDGAPQPLDTERDFEFKPEVQLFKCPTCSREFGKEQALQTHIIRAHKKFWSTNTNRPRKSAGRKPRTVENRYEKYRDRYRAKGLNSRGQPYKKRKMECPICQHIFANPDSLRTHIRGIHHQSTIGLIPNAKKGRPGKKLTKTCPVCSRTFSTRAIMGHHLRAIHSKSVRDFPELDAGTLPNGALQREPGKRPKHKRGMETCPVCKKEFAKAYLYAHVRNQHGTTVTKARAAAAGAQPPVETTDKRPAQTAEHARHVTFCPICGTNIANVQTAVNFGG